MTEYPDCGYDDDLEFAMFMAETIGVTPVPGRAFYRSLELGKQFVRFAFPKKLETPGDSQGANVQNRRIPQIDPAVTNLRKQ